MNTSRQLAQDMVNAGEPAAGFEDFMSICAPPFPEGISAAALTATRALMRATAVAISGIRANLFKIFIFFSFASRELFAQLALIRLVEKEHLAFYCWKPTLYCSLECGGKRSATPLSVAREAGYRSTAAHQLPWKSNPPTTLWTEEGEKGL
jgi:hypothetical protein